MSPTPGRSTLITSAPNQASNCVQVGPDWTWVKSRMRTSVSALVMISSLPGMNSLCTGSSASAENAADGCLLLLQYALRIEVADGAVFRARRRIDHRIDQGGLAGIHGVVDRALQLIRRGRIDA